MEDKMLKIDFAAQVRNLNSQKGYFEKFYEIVGTVTTHREAWQVLEEVRSDYGLDEKYTTYNSFKKAKKAYMEIKYI